MGLERQLNLIDLLKKKSFFLFGPRSSGKSTLIRDQLLRNKPDLIIFDLLDSEIYRDLLKKPKLISERAHSLKAKQGNGEELIIVIDEIQKIPSLLDEVHRLIESEGYRFLLTGSSARKLRRGGSNLLAGRAWTAELFPLT